MSLYVPPREGTRGGRDQFKWSDVKTDKHRENYLGHSVMAPVGRWQQGRDLQWYTKEKGNTSLSASLSNELSKVKQAEEEAMMVALGLKKANRGTADVQQTKEEVSRIMLNMKQEEKESGLGEDDDADIGIKGLGSKRATRGSEMVLTEHAVVPGNVPEETAAEKKKTARTSTREKTFRHASPHGSREKRPQKRARREDRREDTREKRKVDRREDQRDKRKEDIRENRTVNRREEWRENRRGERRETTDAPSRRHQRRSWSPEGRGALRTRDRRH